jgi:intergrase/recombinase
MDLKVRGKKRPNLRYHPGNFLERLRKITKTPRLTRFPRTTLLRKFGFIQSYLCTYHKVLSQSLHFQSKNNSSFNENDIQKIFIRLQ